LFGHLLFLMLAQPAPFATMKEPAANPSPWRGDETFELRLTAEGMAGRGKPPWEYEAVATLTVRKNGQGFTLSVRRLMWWRGSGPADCQTEALVMAQDQEAVLDGNGQVVRLTLQPPPAAAPDLRKCPADERQRMAVALWNAIAAASGAGKQLAFAQKRVPAPDLGPAAFVDHALSYAQTACVDRTPRCRLGIVNARFGGHRPDRTAIDRTVGDRLTMDPEGRPRYYNHRVEERANGFRAVLAIVFRAPDARTRPTRTAR
jgi:hypothetical protein